MPKGFKFLDNSGFDDNGNFIPAPITAQPTTIAPMVPTAANGFGTNLSSPYVSEYDQLSRNRYAETQTPIDREAIRKQKLAEFQAQIDATNQIYNNLIAKAGVEGQGRVGQQRAISARAGTLNSGRGAAQADQVVQYNRGIESDIEARRQAQITAIMTESQNRADAEIAKREEAKRLGADAYLSYLAGTEERKKTNASAVLQSLLAQGLKIEDIGPEQFTQIANSLRMTPDELTNVYKGELSKAAKAAEQVKYERSLKDREFGLDVGKFGFEQQKFGAEFGLKKEEFGFNQNKFNAEFGLKRDELAFDQQYKRAQLNIDYGKLDIEQKKLLADGGSKPLTAEELIKFGNLPAGTTWEDVRGISPVGKLSSEEKKLNSIAISAYDSLRTIQEKLFDENGKVRRNQIVGSGIWAREYGNAITNLSDAIGRLRSGGAINKEEENRFRSLLPRAIDNEATIKSKLRNIELMFKAIDPADSASGIQSTDSLKKELNGGSEGANPKAPISLNSRPLADTKTLASAVLPKFPDGTKAGQCITFLHRIADFPPVGDSKKEKFASVDNFGIPAKAVPRQAQVGMILITDENADYGHGAMINAISSDGKYARVTESNFKGKDTVSHDRIIALNSSRIYGAIIPKKIKTNLA